MDLVHRELSNVWLIISKKERATKETYIELIKPEKNLVVIKYFKNEKYENAISFFLRKYSNVEEITKIYKNDKEYFHFDVREKGSVYWYFDSQDIDETRYFHEKIIDIIIESGIDADTRVLIAKDEKYKLDELEIMRRAMNNHVYVNPNAMYPAPLTPYENEEFAKAFDKLNSTEERLKHSDMVYEEDENYGKKPFSDGEF